MELDIKDREKLVLNAVIDHYIRTGDTISSITLVKKYNVKFSSATIRNVMVTLEELGYLDKTHASSGRIPTSKGYRYYIDSMVQVKDLTAFEKEVVEKTYYSPGQELEQLYSETVELLGNLTQTAVFLLAHTQESPLERVETIYVSERKIILALIFQGGSSRFEEIRLKSTLNREMVSAITVVINRGIEEGEIKTERAVLIALAKTAEFNLGYYLDRFKYRQHGKYVIYGMQNLIYAIDDLTSSETLELLNLLNSSSRSSEFFKTLYESHTQHILEEERIKVILGEELAYEFFNKLGFVLKEVVSHEQKVLVGIIGPRRMHYEKAVSLLDYVGTQLENHLETI